MGHINDGGEDKYFRCFCMSVKGVGRILVEEVYTPEGNPRVANRVDKVRVGEVTCVRAAVVKEVKVATVETVVTVGKGVKVKEEVMDVTEDTEDTGAKGVKEDTVGTGVTVGTARTAGT